MTRKIDYNIRRIDGSVPVGSLTGGDLFLIGFGPVFLVTQGVQEAPLQMVHDTAARIIAVNLQNGQLETFDAGRKVLHLVVENELILRPATGESNNGEKRE